VFLVALLLFWFSGGFNWLDQILRATIPHPVLRGVAFVLTLLFAQRLLMLPFDVHDTFRTEARFGFNRTTVGTFILDKIKVLILAAVLGGGALAVVLAFFEYAGTLAWLYAWAAVTALTVLLHFLAPAVILPLFNRFEPLPNGDLRMRLESLLERAKFPARRLSVVDGSRRTTKSNAFFTGFGANRRIALYDTLVENHSPTEIEAVLAHEIGHCKHGHIRMRLIIGIVHTGILLALFSLLIGNRSLHAAFQVEHTSVYAALVFFSLLYSPVEFALGLAMNALFRKQEYQADHFVTSMGANPAALVSALKQLSVDSLSNLTPHPLSVAINDSHPPLIERIKALQETHPHKKTTNQ
ncbi:MAG: M48 family metallopeptidase, partial [Verrucomicrobiota bacterium]